MMNARHFWRSELRWGTPMSLDEIFEFAEAYVAYRTKLSSVKCSNCGIASGNVGEVTKGLCNLCALPTYCE